MYIYIYIYKKGSRGRLGKPGRPLGHGGAMEWSVMVPVEPIYDTAYIANDT